MPEHVGGQPLPDGEEPDDGHHEGHHGGADEEFATAVFDEGFVRAAAVHEPTAAERMRAAAQSRAEREVPRPGDDNHPFLSGSEGDFDPDAEAEAGEERPGWPHDEDALGTTHGYGYGWDPALVYGEPFFYDPEDGEDPLAHRRYRGHVRWQRPVAWVLAVIMGVGMVALAFSAVSRSASSQQEEPSSPPATSERSSPSQEEGAPAGQP